MTSIVPGPLAPRSSGHPSMLALDRFALGHEDPSVAEHLLACDRCRAHLASVAPEATPLPAWVRPRAPTGFVHRLRRTFRGRARSLMPPILAFGLAAAAVTFVVTRTSLAPDAGSGVQLKGGAPVRVYLKRAEAVRAWRGEAVRPGDRLALAVSGHRPTEVLVLGAPPTEGLWTILWEGHVEPSGELLLPVSFEIDSAPPSGGAPRTERLAVVLTEAPLGQDQRARLTLDPTRPSPGLEKYLFTFAKEFQP